MIPKCERDKKKSLYRDFISWVNSNLLRISLPFRGDKDGSEREKNNDGEMEKEIKRERERERPTRRERERERDRDGK